MKEDHYKKTLEYELEQIKIRDIEWMNSIQKRVEEKDKQQKEWEQEKEKRKKEREADIERRN